MSVGCPPPERRTPAFLHWAGDGGVQVWQWDCPVCPFHFRDHDRDEVLAAARAHVCEYGWSAIPARVPLPPPPSWPAPERYFPPEKRKRKGA